MSPTFALASSAIEIIPFPPEEVFSGVFSNTDTHTQTVYREAIIASPALFADGRDERVGAGWLLGH